MLKLILETSSFRDLDNLDLDDLTIPDVIKLPNNNNNSSYNNNKNLGNNNNNNVNKGYAISDENNSKSSIISNVKVRGFSYLTGGQGEKQQCRNVGMSDFKNREGNIGVERDFKTKTQGNYASENEYDSDIGGLSSKYTSLDRRREEKSSPPKSPPPFSKAESRFEREQRIKVSLSKVETGTEPENESLVVLLPTFFIFNMLRIA